MTRVPATHKDETFVTGLAYVVPQNLPGGIKDVTWSGRLLSNQPGLELDWQWAAAVYSGFDQNYNNLSVKPVDKKDVDNAFANNDDKAGTPENFKANVVKGARGNGDKNYTGDFSGGSSGILGYADLGNALNENGADDQVATAAWGGDTVTGFDGVFNPGQVISKVELVMHSYVDSPIGDDVKAVLSLGDWHKDVTIKKEWINVNGPGNPGDVVVDVTDVRDWQTYDLHNMQLALDLTKLKSGQAIKVDAIGLRVTSVRGTPEDKVVLPKSQPNEPYDREKLASVFNQTIGSTEVWKDFQGQGITIAVVDSGVGKTSDIGERKFQDVNFNREYHDGKDKYGHGTFVASVAAGNGHHSKGEYVGVAPSANILNVRVSNDHGMSTEADVIEALSWVMLNKDAYKIRIVNLSLNSSVAESYHVSPLSAAVEFLWMGGIVVVASAGNSGGGALYPPANDPFVITVGATDDKGTPGIGDDTVATFSAYGTNVQGIAKPDIVAPGRNIVMYLPKNSKLVMGQEHGNNRVNDEYFRMSGTSISAPMVSGAAALLLQSNPSLSPDQVKYRLMSTASKSWDGYNAAQAGAGIVDIDAAIHATTLEAANKGNMPSEFLRPLIGTLLGSDVNWTSVNWTSVNWTSVNWTSVDWNSVNWTSVNWTSVNWTSVNWTSVNWTSVNWTSVNWNSDYWGD